MVVTTDLTGGCDEAVSFACHLAEEGGGSVVVVVVLSGRLVDGVLAAGERGRVRRQREDEAEVAAREQVVRVGASIPAHVVSLFGDVASDTLLVAHNLAADAVVVGAGHPATAEIIRAAEIPVIVVPNRRSI